MPEPRLSTISPLVLQQIAALPCWSGTVDVQALDGGITNRNYRVQDSRARYVVRLGEDLPHHGILRWHELAAARAAFSAGVSPEVVFAAAGVMVSRFIEGRSLMPADVRDPRRLGALVALMQRCHLMMARHLHSPVLMFWVFQVVRNYLEALAGAAVGPLHADLPRFAGIAHELEAAVGKISIVFGHNDLLAGNFMDDGARLWLIDWEYAGFNSPLFDLANLSMNNGFEPALDRELLLRYFGRPADAQQWRAFTALRCASALRETLWALVSHNTSLIDFDYAGYARDWRGRLDGAWQAFRASEAST